MHDDTAAAVQARLARRAAEQAGLATDQLWWQYFELGGEVGALEIEAYLHECLQLPSGHRDLITCAVNELAGGTTAPRAPFSWELEGSSGTGRRPGPGPLS
ncbi:hypothetical protein GMA12_02925 [Kocuria sediminis]|uniref:Uncharacterized protein n=1 Tax=Kocuria sediminis TaxID=1038857 RepID=A0A6N8GFW1_9MICC|nr:hypothetical protein [Kocuria sediminis]MUN62106.1 hypothetical protein [Kocuria sediminis]